LAVTVALGLGCDARTELSKQEVAIVIAPRSAAIGSGASVQFGAAVSGSVDTAVIWSAPDCGSVTQTGLFTAPATAATCSVLVTSRADATKSDRASVSVAQGGGTPPWRAFSAASPWNTPIPPNPALEPNSAALVADFMTSSPYGVHLDINIASYSIPVYWADASTPTFPVLATLGGEGWNGYPATLAMPIPAGAAPDPQTDHHMAVVDRTRAIEWGCWDMAFSAAASPQWQAGVCATADLNGTGVRVPKNVANPWWLAHGARACGFPLVAGLILADEIAAGRIEHALVVAYPHIQRAHFTSPASTDSAIGVDAPGGVPCGGRLQYDPTIDVATLGLSRSGQAIVRALQVYGAYVGDYSGALTLYAENSAAARAYWSNGVLGTGELAGLDLARFRVVKYGTMY
jgi:hypothetical protein